MDYLFQFVQNVQLCPSARFNLKPGRSHVMMCLVFCHFDTYSDIGGRGCLWCRNCNIETNAEVCPVCGSTTAEDTPVEVQWCSHCAIPVVTTFNQPDKNVCPLCGGKTKYISTDLRPVFPEERLLIEILLKKCLISGKINLSGLAIIATM